MSEHDPVNHPKHYASDARCSGCNEPIECIDIVRTLQFNRGNAIKYLWRAGSKGETIQDLEKAIWYIQDEIAMLKGEKNPKVHALAGPKITNHKDGSTCAFSQPKVLSEGAYDFLCVTHNYHVIRPTSEVPRFCPMYVVPNITV